MVRALLLSWLFYIRRQHWSNDQSGSIYGEYILVHLCLTAYISHIFGKFHYIPFVIIDIR